MAFTPKRSVQFAGDDEVKEFVYGSPYSEGSSTDFINATSTLTYINSQLIAHGFARGSGVSFDGLSKQDADRLSKCMLGMLGQRAEDVSRVETTTTKLRTLSYENERIAGMQRAAEEQLASAERDTNLFKSKLSASNKALQSCEAAHKATSADMQRTKTAMQSLRQTHVAEIKRKEKEIEKILDRWQKISDSQTKLGSSSSGTKFTSTVANPTSFRPDESVRRGPDLLEDALEAAEMSRKGIAEENTGLKNVVLSTANELARILRTCRIRSSGVEEEGVQPFKQSDFFALSAPENAGERMGELLGQFRHSIGIGSHFDIGSTTPLETPPNASENIPRRPDAVDSHGQSKEVQRLQNTIVDLRRQLVQAQTQTETGSYSNQAQEIVRRFVNNDDEKANVHERQLLEKIRKELDQARKKVDEAALALRDEKAALEEERVHFTREQHLWRSQMCIPQNDEGPRAVKGLDAYFEAPAEPLEFPMSPPRAAKGKRPKSPKKTMMSPRRPAAQHHSPARPTFAVGKSAKKVRPGAALAKKGNSSLLGASTSKPKVIPPMETEVIPPPRLPAATSSNLIVPNSFVLPPPSPLASLPRPEASILSSFQPIPGPSFGSSDEDTASSDGQTTGDPQPSPRKPFPVAKPLAQHMIHAYSPARPSPLSRILMRSNSPATSLSGAESDQASDVEGNPAPSTGTRTYTPFDQELRMEELMSASDESPLRNKGKKSVPSKAAGKTAPTKVGAASTRRTSGERSTSKPSAARSTNKENGTSKVSKPLIQTANTKSGQVGKTLLAGKGGARRVPIGSADAAPIGPGWK